MCSSILPLRIPAGGGAGVTGWSEGSPKLGSAHASMHCALERPGFLPSPDLRPLVGGKWVRQAPGVGVTLGARQGGPVGRTLQPRATAPTPRTCLGRGPEARSRGSAPPRPGRAARWLAEPVRYANESDPARTCRGAADWRPRTNKWNPRL